ncbi:MAG TPA: DUF4162 domain-containing protein, partial [Acidimicrobiales bacterium]|nr:DUF4162 domain-containing protein [Acidimicrobiales bacterium]
MRHLTRTTITVETTEPITGLDDLAGVHNVAVEGDRTTFDVDTAQLDAVVHRLAGLGVRSLISRPPTLEEMFLRHYGDELAELEAVPLDSGDGHRAATGTVERP